MVIAITDVEEPPIDPKDQRDALYELDGAITRERDLACGILTRDSVPFVTVVRFASPGRSVSVTAVLEAGEPYYAWHDADGRSIGPADDIPGVIDRIRRELCKAASS